MSYKELESYRQATIVYDMTVEFCKKFLDKTYRIDTTRRTDRMVDQMVQAARSGKQNIVEGTAASRTSPQTEVHLLGVARASFEELLEDYFDFLRQRNFPVWDKDNPKALAVRRLVYKPNKTYTTYKSYKTDKTHTTYESYKTYLENPEEAANCLACIINQTNYLLDMQIKAVKKEREAGGFSMESREQRLKKILAEKEKVEKANDELAKQFLKKEKKGPISPTCGERFILSLIEGSRTIRPIRPIQFP